MINPDTLAELVRLRYAGLFRFAGTVWILDGKGALYCPANDTLLVADLHFEKGSYLSQYASPVPRYDSRATITALSALIDRYQPASVVCLGDSFHDRGAFSRITCQDSEALLALTKRVSQWVWVVGNHDPDIPASVAGNVVEHWQVAIAGHQIIGCHEPDATLTTQYQIVGHFHPKGQLAMGKGVVRGKCLVATPSLLVMPALGQFTGGLSVQAPALLTLAPVSERQCWMLYRGRVYPLPSGS
ncbi:ligase-associated DNA damage response endonuclease PdeM [Alteromonas sp. AMM-1]|uniref:ligase-associated DNA damage response endonuclease PdeM n=1 Tax=Alteromonas sp. AMM-1 TaxID=3394233 RepID=UPI0039A5BB3A